MCATHRRLGEPLSGERKGAIPSESINSEETHLEPLSMHYLRDLIHRLGYLAEALPNELVDCLQTAR